MAVLILFVLLYRLTIGKIDNIASEIWKFQRYRLIADFTERFCLPPPFTVFSFIYMFLKFLMKKCMGCKKRLTSCCGGEQVCRFLLIT